MRRLLRLLVAGSIPWALFAHGAELRIGLAADVTSMDPHFLAIAPNINIAWHVFDALTHVDEDTRLIPGLAVAWRAVDATTWEFRLRPGVRFHDGAELTAEDVVFSIERTLKVPNGQYGIFTRRIVGKEVLDALKKFVAYGLTDGQKFADELGYIPLPKEVSAKSEAALKSIE